MRRLRVGAFENLACPAIVADACRQPPADRRRRNERRRKTEGLLREIESALRIALHDLFRHRRLDDGAPPVCGRPVDETRRRVGIDRRQRPGPIAAPGAVIQDRLPRPGGRRMRIGAHGVLQSGLMIAAASRLDVQAAQAKPMRLMMLEHRVVGGDGALPVARQLRGLSAKELGHWLMLEKPSRVGGVFGCRSRIARADRDHAARQREKTLLAFARAPGQGHEGGDVEDETQDAPDDRNRDRQHGDGAERQQQRDLVFNAAPRDRHDARIVGEPHEAPGSKGQRSEKHQQTKHILTAFPTPARGPETGVATRNSSVSRPGAQGLAPAASFPIAASRIDPSASSAASFAPACAAQPLAAWRAGSGSLPKAASAPLTSPRRMAASICDTSAAGSSPWVSFRTRT